MFYRIRVDLAYPEEARPRVILAQTQALLQGAIVINPGQPNQERGYIILEECYHDEDPTKPCEIIETRQVED